MEKVSKKQPLISIIVPVYKVEKYLDRCVESIVNQTYKNLEIILVDDGSPDNCPKMCDEWAKKDKRIKVFHNKNNGVSYTRNFAINKSTGEYVGFVDSDDYIDLKMYEILLKNILDTNSEISICDVTRDKNKMYTNKNKNKNIIVYTQRQYIKKYFRIGSQTCEYYPVNKLYKRDILTKEMFPEKYREGEDTLAVLKVILNVQKIVYCPINLYYYRMNENSATSHFTETDWELFDVWNEIVEHVKKYNSEYLEYAILNQKRLNFTFLMRLAMNIENKILKNDIRVKELILNLRKDEKMLLKSSIRIDRKIFIFLFCRNYFFFSKILYKIKK